MSTCSPEGQLYPRLHQDQQVEGGNSAPLLCSGETPPGVLHPALEPSAQVRHGPFGAGPEEGHKNDQRDGAPPKSFWRSELFCGSGSLLLKNRPDCNSPKYPFLHFRSFLFCCFVVFFFLVFFFKTVL